MDITVAEELCISNPETLSLKVFARIISFSLSMNWVLQNGTNSMLLFRRLTSEAFSCPNVIRYLLMDEAGFRMFFWSDDDDPPGVQAESIDDV